MFFLKGFLRLQYFCFLGKHLPNFLNKHIFFSFFGEYFKLSFQFLFLILKLFRNCRPTFFVLWMIRKKHFFNFLMQYEDLQEIFGKLFKHWFPRISCLARKRFLGQFLLVQCWWFWSIVSSFLWYSRGLLRAACDFFLLHEHEILNKRQTPYFSKINSILLFLGDVVHENRQFL